MKIQLLVLLLLGFDAQLGVELVCTMSVWRKPGEEIGTVWKQTAATDLGDDRKQAV